MARGVATKRKAKRACYCRLCDEKLAMGTDIIHTSTYRNRGQKIIFCIPCMNVLDMLKSQKADEVRVEISQQLITFTNGEGHVERKSACERVTGGG